MISLNSFGYQYVRLDELLVVMGYASSREGAKRLIKMGSVLVNGKVVKKPSRDVDFSVKIDVRNEERPGGYWKLKMLDEKFHLINPGDRVVDLGSSAGGFLLYAGEKAESVTGVEFSKEFKNRLREVERKMENVRVVFGDAFRISPESLGMTDVLLIDITTEVEGSLKLLKRYAGILRKNGRVLLVLKDVTDFNFRKSEFEGFKVCGIEKSNRKEVYVVLEKK